jgi:hypothetical protein
MASGELLDAESELPVMSFDVGRGQWFQFKTAGTAQVIARGWCGLQHRQVQQRPLWLCGCKAIPMSRRPCAAG